MEEEKLKATLIRKLTTFKSELEGKKWVAKARVEKLVNDFIPSYKIKVLSSASDRRCRLISSKNNVVLASKTNIALAKDICDYLIRRPHLGLRNAVSSEEKVVALEKVIEDQKAALEEQKRLLESVREPEPIPAAKYLVGLAEKKQKSQDKINATLEELYALTGKEHLIVVVNSDGFVELEGQAVF